MGAWKAIIANVEGENYASELKLQGDQIIENAFFDPNKNFTFEKYFDKHVKSHKLHAAAQAPVPEWRKIYQFMKNIKCKIYKMITGTSKIAHCIKVLRRCTIN